MTEVYSDSIFFIDVNKIHPNPYQPRREFEEGPLKELSESIRQYGVLQPLVVTRLETAHEDGIIVEYELIAGERRLRASKLAGLSRVPAIIRKEQDPMLKLELAIIENLQREDLNAVERARAFQRFVDEFKFTHTDIAKKVGRSRVYVSNSLRILMLPDAMLNALSEGKINEGHTRPLMMLQDRPEEQQVLFKEMLYRKMSVRDAEQIARTIAKDKARKPHLLPDPEIEEVQNKLQEALGTRVLIDRREKGGQIKIDFFSNEDLHILLENIKSLSGAKATLLIDRHIEADRVKADGLKESPIETGVTEIDSVESEVTNESSNVEPDGEAEQIEMLDDRTTEEKEQSEKDTDDLYNISNFSV
jgi:ParB family chromosome partitioning protein